MMRGFGGLLPSLSSLPPDASRLVRAAAGPVGAIAVVLALTVVVAAWQPIGSPWWINANSDSTYTASGVDLMAGQQSVYLGDPGTPLVDLMAGTVELRYVAHKLTSEHETPLTYAGQRLLHLDDSRVFFRGYSLLFFLAGIGLAFGLLWRLLGTPWWGAAGGLLFLCAPGLQALAIQYRPDVLLAGLVLATGYLIARAAERRDAWLYTLAVLLLGLAMTVKAQAVGLVFPLVGALAVRPPVGSWPEAFVRDGRNWLRRYRWPLLVFFAVWTLLCVTFDRSRVPISVTHEQAAVVQRIGIATLVYVVAVALVAAVRPLRQFSRGPLRPYGLVPVGAFAAGILLPGTLALNDLPEMLVKIVHDLAHGGIEPGLAQSPVSANELVHAPLLSTLVIIVLAGVAAGIGISIGDLQPALWFSGAAAMFVIATIHLGPPETFAPAFVLSVPPVLWLARRGLPRVVPAVPALAIVVVMLVPTLQLLTKPRDSARLQERSWQTIEADGAKLLTVPGTVALMPDLTSPVPDIRWHDFVQQIVDWKPAYPYHYLPATALGAQTAQSAGLKAAYFIGGRPLQMAAKETVPLGFGTFVFQPLPQFARPSLGIGVARLSKPLRP
jgi:Dolichyl-phosphate-mannose-protein mannosyltransferase